jgi:16S rRNA (cytosine967-C5)-methyltransferase
MASRSAPRRVRTGTARERAAEVLVRVETESAFAAPVLDAALDREPALSSADRALCTELVYGVLRTAPTLDIQLQQHAGRPGSISKLDSYARATLRLAAYQILALDRIPPRAAVHSAVEALNRDRSKGLGSFANAILRKLAQQRPESLPEDSRTGLALSSIPENVVTKIASALGSRAEALSVLRAALSRTPPAGIRVNVLRTQRDALIERLKTERPGAEFHPGAISPWAIGAHGAGDLSALASYSEGLFSMQEEGAQCVALATGAREGMKVLDACAGRGGKTGLLAAMMEGTGVLHAVEMYPDRVARIVDEITRLGFDPARLHLQTAAADLTRGLGALGSKVPSDGYDRVLVDAPCSGLGTLARRPDLLARTTQRVMHSEDGAMDGEVEAMEAVKAGPRAALPTLQGAILDRVAPLVSPGGQLVYAVCTLSEDEGPGVLRAFCARHPAFVPAQGGSEIPERLRPAEVVLRPDRDGTDGFMVFRLERKV